jgi:CDP-diacylglycerol--glycerol-3-phosphate 3-phosphatidyltransferase
MNLSNGLTLARVLLIPVFLAVLLNGMPNARVVAASVFLAAAVTDGLDGYLARKRREVTNFGKLMDPLADKLLISSALIALVQVGDLQGWIAILIIGREFFVTGLRGVAASDGLVIAAGPLGKIKAVAQMAAILWVLLDGPFHSYLMYAAVFFTLWSGADYFIQAWKMGGIQMK